LRWLAKTDSKMGHDAYKSAPAVQESYFLCGIRGSIPVK
jgi:hypothetical protein